MVGIMKTWLAVLAIILSLVIVPSFCDDVDAVAGTDETWYCYGDIMILKYPYDSAGLLIYWDADYYQGGELVGNGSFEGTIITIDVSSFDYVEVKQTVHDSDGTDYDSTVVGVVPLGLKSGDSISVRFMDGSYELSRYTLDSSVSVVLGNRFVELPDNPSKTNYNFSGWFLDQACTQPFDPFLPITKNTTVYAGWISAGSSSSITVSGYIVTFNAAPGLTYQVVGTGDGAVSFTVSVMDGYRFDMDSIQASVGTTKISPVNGVYTLSGITKDTVIEITGDRLYNVSYDMSNVSISSEDLGKDSLSVSFSPSFGWSGVSLKVIMGGTDVTSQYVNGSSVDIDQLTGDVIIMAQADLPWIYVLVIVIIVAIALVAVLLARKRKVD